MIWSVPFFLFFFYSLKEFIFFSSFFVFNSFSIFMSSISFLVFLLINFFFFSYFSSFDYFFYNIMFFCLISFSMLCFLCSDSFYFLFFLEMSIFPMVFLIFFFSKDYDKISSVIFMLFVNILGSVPFMIFSSSFSMFYFFSLDIFFCFNFLFFNSYFLIFCFSLMLVCKIPIFLSHFWLTKAHVSASSSCSMFLASIMLKLGSFGLIKFSYNFLDCFKNFMPLALSLSVAGSLMFCFLMVRFFDLKYLVACSSIVHMSFIMPFFMFMNSMGVLSGMLMMVGHGLVSYFLFFLVGLCYEFSLSRSIDFSKSFESLFKNFVMIFFIFMFFNLGVPPFINFFSELISCSFLFGYSVLVLMFFFFSMVISVTFTMFLSSKLMYGKKFLYIGSDLNYCFNLVSMLFVLSIFFCSFLF